jgi:hypothetical protein
MDEHAAQVIYMDPRPSLHAWAEQKYGLRMGMDPDGNYTKDYTVSDARRFMLYQIKFMK